MNTILNNEHHALNRQAHSIIHLVSLQCKSLIDTYGPQLIQLLDDAIEPDAICRVSLARTHVDPLPDHLMVFAGYQAVQCFVDEGAAFHQVLRPLASHPFSPHPLPTPL